MDFNRSNYMTKSALLLERLKLVPKSYFSFVDLKKFYTGKEENLKVVVHRLVNQKRLYRLLRGYYTLNLTLMDWEQFACELVQPSYISLEYALHRYGIIDQIPTRITLVTPKKGREFTELPGQILEYSHLSPNFYFGYKVDDNTLIAEKEKALLDELYLISLKKRHLSIESLDLSMLNKKRFYQWLEKFPPYTQKSVQKLKL